MTTTSTEPTTYAAAYAILAAIAERLKGTGNVGAIDMLAEDVRAARVAYDTCRTRLSARACRKLW